MYEAETGPRMSGFLFVNAKQRVFTVQTVEPIPSVVVRLLCRHDRSERDLGTVDTVDSHHRDD